MEQNTYFSQMNFVEETFLSLGSWSEHLGEEQTQGQLFFSFPSLHI